MKFEDIPQALANEDCIEINNGEVLIKKKLSCVIGGVNIYKIMVDFTKEDLEPLYFDTLDELDDFSIISGGEQNIRRCLVCDGLPITKEQRANGIEEGCYYDIELNQYYCCESCLRKWFNDVYGENNWKKDGDVSNPFMGVYFYTRSNEFAEWEPYRMKFIKPYDWIHHNLTLTTEEE